MTMTRDRMQTLALIAAMIAAITLKPALAAGIFLFGIVVALAPAALLAPAKGVVSPSVRRCCFFTRL